ncbi:MAG: 7TM diverse intracellular signaling domain-containing protein [Bdellovibrionota bacterium]|nr:7TM diverse intracellular signaling domain-containing protein [Bdellovibrionota bacterium]
MVKISRLFICMFFLFFTTLVNANSLILKQKEFYEPGFHLSFLKDPSGKLTIDDVNSEKWSSQFKKNTKKVPRFGFTKSTIWLRIKVINNSPEKNWLFNISLPTLDKVTFFKKENGWVKTFGGDTLPSDQWETRYKDIIFSLSKNRESTYFFKIKNRGGTNVPMTLMSKKYFQNYKQNYDLFYGGYFMVLTIMFFYNLVIGIHLRSTVYMLFVGYLFSWTFLSLAITGFGRYVVTDWVSFSNEGMPFFISCAFLFFISFVRKFLDIKEKNYNLDRFFYYLILFSGGFISLTPFLNLRHSLIIVALFGGFASLLIFSSIVSFFKTSRSARIAAFSFSVILLGAILKVLSGTGITPVTFLSEQGILIGALVQLIFLSLGLADRFKSIQELALEREKEVSDILEDNLKKERALSNLLEEARAGLTRAIEKRTRETKDLLDNMNSAVFAIGNDGKILNPVSKCSEKIFKKKIVGKKISEVLYYNIKKGTKEYSDIVSVFSLIFGESDLQFLALADNLPTKVQLPIDEKGKNIMLKLSYAPILDDEGLVYKVLCIAEDVTGSEEYYLESFDSVLNMQFLKEISENDNKEELSKKLAYFVEEGFKILEDFVSPLSDT